MRAVRSVSKISFLFCLPAVNIWRFRVLLRDVLRGREERSEDVEGDLVAVVDHQGGDCIMVARSNFHLATRWRGQMFNFISENEGIGYKAIASGRGQILIPPPAERL